MEALKSIVALPIIGILRGFTLEQLPNILGAVARGGLRNVEITMNSPSATEQIRLAGDQLNVGAGTVTSLKLLDEALEAGAKFIVTPTVNTDVITRCAREQIPVFPGAFSPTEIFQAWELGATMVKIFPAETGGAAYVRAIRGPFPNIGLLPTGGVDLRTAEDYLKAGAAGLGVGSPLFNKERIEAGDWRWLETQARAFASLFLSAQSQRK
jgi:2-dehydro-3-deoxyphosphogluconate aldolase/(4S)-4-hydroxy-2-oxoglutarate aldolase